MERAAIARLPFLFWLWDVPFWIAALVRSRPVCRRSVVNGSSRLLLRFRLDEPIANNDLR